MCKAQAWHRRLCSIGRARTVLCGRLGAFHGKLDEDASRGAKEREDVTAFLRLASEVGVEPVGSGGTQQKKNMEDSLPGMRRRSKRVNCAFCLGMAKLWALIPVLLS